MSVATHVLASLPPELQKNGAVRIASHSHEGADHSLDNSNGSHSDKGQSRPFALAKGRSSELEAGAPEDWQNRLSRGELPRGGVVELSSDGGIALATSIALRACSRVQRESKELGDVAAWCAFVDPTKSLFAPGVRAAQVDLSRLLVVRPNPESIIRATLRLVESKVFPLVIVDLMGVPSDQIDLPLSSWVRTVRRLSLTLEATNHSVVLLTSKYTQRPLPLPVTQRLLLSRDSVESLDVTVSKSPVGPWGKTHVHWRRTSSSIRKETDERTARAGSHAS